MRELEKVKSYQRLVWLWSCCCAMWVALRRNWWQPVDTACSPFWLARDQLHRYPSTSSGTSARLMCLWRRWSFRERVHDRSPPCARSFALQASCFWLRRPFVSLRRRIVLKWDMFMRISLLFISQREQIQTIPFFFFSLSSYSLISSAQSKFSSGSHVLSSSP